MELMGTSPKIDLYSHPLFLRMVNEHGFESCDKDTFPQFLQKPGLSMVVFIEDPNRMKETMDALVIAPELAKSCGLIEHKAVVGPPNARKLAVTYGFKRWPALVFFDSYQPARPGLPAGALCCQHDRRTRHCGHLPSAVHARSRQQSYRGEVPSVLHRPL